MTTGRYTYAPAPQKRTHRPVLRLLLIPITVCAALWALSQHQADKPVPAPATAATVTEQQLVDLRLQAFRAGWASAVQQGCRVVLASPIGGQP